MRGVYTAGVLDAWMDRDISFETIYGVSAGAIQACSYMSRQQGRGYACIVDYLEDWRYCSIRSLLLTGNLFGVKRCYQDIPDRLNPFDYHTFAASPTRLFAVATDVDTGLPVYRPIRDMRQDTPSIRASASLPFVSRMVRVEGHRLLDGGVADSIPLEKALSEGASRAVVVLTQHAGYRKASSSQAGWARLRYPGKKAFCRRLQDRPMRYNQQLAYVERMEAEGRAFVIRPGQPVAFGRVERDRGKLQALYQQGRQDAARLYPAMEAFLRG